MTGVVSFPSFHTTMALAYVYGFRRTGAIGVVDGDPQRRDAVRDHVLRRPLSHRH